MRPGSLRAFHYAWRGWFLAVPLAALILARALAESPLRPGWLGLLALGLGWRAWAGFHIAGHSNGPAWSGPALASTGPYRISRHPLYFANSLCAIGLILYAHCLPAWGGLSVAALILAHHEALARYEEAYLLGAGGSAYQGYMRVTPRWPWPFRRSAGAEGAPMPGAGPAGDGTGRWRDAWARQGWNLAKGGAGALLIWIAAALR